MDPFTYCRDRYGVAPEGLEPFAYWALSALVELLERTEPQDAPRFTEPPVANRVNRGGKWVWEVPDSAPRSICKFCPQEVAWIRTSKKHALLPLDADGTCHFETCTGKQDEGTR